MLNVPLENVDETMKEIGVPNGDSCAVVRIERVN